MSIIRSLADFISRSSPGQVPESVKRKMHAHLVDTMTAGIAGSSRPSAGRLRSSFSATYGGDGACTVWGTDVNADPRTAALLNGTASHELDIDDTGGCDHSGAVVIPAVVAACQASVGPIRLDEMLASIAMGYEVARRVQYAFGGYTALNGRGWHSTGVCGPFGAVAGVARAAGLSAAETAHALGIVSSTVSGNWSFRTGDGDNKALHAGYAAAAGVEAVSFAAHGVKGSQDVFEDCWGGLIRLLGESANDADFLTSGLGSRWVANEASLKPYATCASTHPMIEVAMRMVTDGVAPEDVQRIEIVLSPLVVDMCGELDRDSLRFAHGRKFSIPFAISSVLAHGSLRMADVLDGPRREDVTFDLIGRCSVAVDASLSGARGDGYVRMVSKGGVRSYKSESLMKPEDRVRTIEDVLVKAGDVLRSTGTQDYLSLVESVAHADPELPIFSQLYPDRAPS